MRWGIWPGPSEWEQRGREYATMGRRNVAEILAEGKRRARRRRNEAQEARRALDAEEAQASTLFEGHERQRLAHHLRSLDRDERAQLRAVAIHEAGHAVQGIEEGAGVECVEIRFDTRYGRTIVTGGRYRSRRKVSPRCDVAGIVAGEIAGVPLPESWAASDLRSAASAARDTESVRAAVRATLRRRWSSVERLAEELMRYGYVAGPNAEAIVWASGLFA